DNLGNGTMQVTFSARSISGTTYENSKIEVVTLSTNDGNGSVTPVELITINTGVSYKQYTVKLPKTSDDFFGFRIPHNGTTNTTEIYIDDVYYEVSPPPTITVSKKDIICFGTATGEATVNIEGGAGDVTITWEPIGGT